MKKENLFIMNAIKSEKDVLENANMKKKHLYMIKECSNSKIHDIKTFDIYYKGDKK